MSKIFLDILDIEHGLYSFRRNEICVEISYQIGHAFRRNAIFVITKMANARQH